MVSEDEHLPYERPALSKGFLRGSVSGFDLPLEDDEFYRRLDIDLRLASRACDLDPLRRLVRMADGREIGYHACVLAPGARPLRPPVPGGDDPGLFVLRSRRDSERLRAAASHAQSAVVVGSGFIGCEAAVSLACRGIEVTMVSSEPLPQQDRLGVPLARRLDAWLAEAGVRRRCGVQVEGFPSAGVVRLTDAASLPGDLVLLAVGAAPRGDLGQRAGLAAGHERIPVDPSMRTRVDGLWAAGDVALASNATAGRPLVVEHWGEALRMGEVAGHVAAGEDDVWAQVPGFWSELGERTVKYAAWGDGFDDCRLVEHGDEGFTAWYARDGIVVGVLTHEADEDYERGRRLVEQGTPIDEVCAP